jgi:hypothetical protein
MKELLKQILFLVVGGIVFTTLFVVGFIYTTFKHIIKFDYSLAKQLCPIVSSITLLFDGLANAGAGELLNDVFKIEGKIKFGKWYQTISAITGLLFIYVKDIKLRPFLDKVLGKNHCVEAISEEDKFYHENNK